MTTEALQTEVQVLTASLNEASNEIKMLQKKLIQTQQENHALNYGLQNRLCELERMVMNITEEKKVLAEQLESSQKQLALTKAKFAEIREATAQTKAYSNNESLMREIEELRMQNHNYAAEISDLRALLRANATGGGGSAKSDIHEAEILDLKKKVESLTIELEKSKDAKSQGAGQGDSILLLLEENNKLKGRLMYSEKVICELQMRVEISTEENAQK